MPRFPTHLIPKSLPLTQIGGNRPKLSLKAGGNEGMNLLHVHMCLASSSPLFTSSMGFPPPGIETQAQYTVRYFVLERRGVEGRDDMAHGLGLLVQYM